MHRRRLRAARSNTIPARPCRPNRDITVKVFAPDTPGSTRTIATVDPDNVVPEGNEFDNDAQVSTTVGPCNGQADCTAQNAFYELTIDKTQVKPERG